jgi:hypothetical protein
MPDDKSANKLRKYPPGNSRDNRTGHPTEAKSPKESVSFDAVYVAGSKYENN